MEAEHETSVETFEGTLEHVVYTNERNHWSVARFRVAASGERITIVGTLPALRAGELLKVTGRSVVHEKFGPQFEVTRFTPVTPTSKKGIRRYLASGRLHGTGKVLAERIVEHFGVDTLDVIDHTPERLLEVEGIGKKKLRQILDSWSKEHAARDTLVFLQGHGFGPALAARVHEVYGAGAPRTCRKHPYHLARDVPGVGFIMADRVARSLGVDEEDPDRLVAGIRHTLQASIQDGHVGFPAADLVNRSARLLQVEPLLVETALEAMIRDADLRTAEGGEPGGRGEDGRLVYLPPLHEAECEVAAALTALRDGRGVPGEEVDRHLAAVRCTNGGGGRGGDGDGIALTDDQLAAVRLALIRRFAVITGGPGVGKTTIVRAIVTTSRRLGLRVELAAPTGRAAKRLTEATGMNARTMHRMLEFDPQTGHFQRGPGRPLDADLVLIDETSMVDILLARNLLMALAPRASLVWIGDADQLPSVGPGRVLGDVLESGVFASARLTQVFRQAEGGQILENAHRINRGELPSGGQREDSDFFLVSREDPAGSLRLVEELVTERIPRKFGLKPGRDIQVLTPMYRGEVGADNLNARLQALINPGEAELVRGSLRLRPGDRVMQLANDYEKNVFNGDVGEVARVLPEGRVLVEFDRRGVEYETADLDNLTLAYAVSVHKAQGSEYPAVVIPLSSTHWPLLQRNLLYTAVTRGKQLVVVVGERRALARAVRNDRIRSRGGRLIARLRAAADPAAEGEQGG